VVPQLNEVFGEHTFFGASSPALCRCVIPLDLAIAPDLHDFY
jgi:hypothetical protein